MLVPGASSQQGKYFSRARIAARIRTRPLMSAGYAAMAVSALAVPTLIVSGFEIGPWIGPNTICAVVLVLVFRASADSGTDMTSRPGWFLLVSLLGSTLAVALAWNAGKVIGYTAPYLPGAFPYADLAGAWLNTMVWGSLFGWIYFLYMRRNEDRNTFSALMTRSSLLSRDVAEQRLLAARAQIDPELVVQVLREVKQRYRDAPVDASALLDHLIAYLRLAMHRVRDSKPTFASELALCRAYCAMRGAQIGRPIALVISDMRAGGGDEPLPSVSLFFLVRQALLLSVEAGATKIALAIELHDRFMQLSFDIDHADSTPDQWPSLEADLRQLAGEGASIVSHTLPTGASQHVVQIRFD